MGEQYRNAYISSFFNPVLKIFRSRPTTASGWNKTSAADGRRNRQVLRNDLRRRCSGCSSGRVGQPERALHNPREGGCGLWSF